ncbi:MAG: hypothetical protein ACLFPD_10570 [Desulfosudaceae bacterium]
MRNRTINHRIILLLLFDLVAGLALMVWVAHRTDDHMSSELLTQAEIVEQALNVANVKQLSGTRQDLRQPG